MTAMGHAACANDLACNSLLLLKYQSCIVCLPLTSWLSFGRCFVIEKLQSRHQDSVFLEILCGMKSIFAKYHIKFVGFC